MEIKKNPKANLEKFKGVFLLTGLAFSLGLMLFAFSWSAKAEAADDLGVVEAISEDEVVMITKQDIKPPPPPEPPPVIEVINIVEDNVEVDDTPDFDEEMDEDEEIEIDDTEDEVEESEPEIFVIVEDPPEYPGGILALRKFIANNVVYPAIARESDIQGKVYVKFVVTKTGAVDKVQIVRGVDDLLDVEAVKVVKKLAKFKPGRQRGKNVSVWYTVPINFKLN